MTMNKIQILDYIWKRGVNQTKLSRMLGCSEPRLSRILNGYAKATNLEVLKFSEIFEIKIEKAASLLGGRK